MKLTDALAKIFPSSAFPDNDLAALLGASSLKDLEIPDAVMSKFDSVYMTSDRAENDPEISRKLKNKHWGYFADDVEKKIKQNIVAAMPDEYKTKWYGIPEGKVNGIYDRLEILSDAYKHALEKGAGEDLKTASEKWRRAEKELRDQVSKLEGEKKTLSEEFAAKESGIKMNYALRTKLQGYLPKVDPNILKSEAQKNFLVNSTIDSLQSGYLLEFDKENPSVISFMNKDRTDVYEGNAKVTLDQFLEKQLDPYLVKNNGGQKKADSDQSKKGTFTKPEGRGMTADEMRWAHAQSVANV